MRVLAAVRISGGRALMIRRGLLILLVSGTLGLIANYVSPRGVPLLGPVPVRELRGVTRIDLAQARDLYRSKGAVFVDARSGDEFQAGHIPGAVLLTQEMAERGISAFREIFPPDTLLAVYCSGAECESSAEVAERLAEAGYTHVRVLPGGWEEWQARGYPVERNGVAGAASPASPGGGGIPAPGD
jgi:rhodanese-related sulfurtransferase